MVDFASNDQLQAKLGQFIPFDGRKAPGGSGDGITDGFGIAGIMLRRLHIHVDNWWGDQSHVMAMLAKPPGSVMGTPAGFHPDAERWYIGNKGQQCTAREALAKHDVPAVIHPNDVKHLLRDVDAEYTHLLCHGTRLLVVNGCPKDHNHSGSSKPF